MTFIETGKVWSSNYQMVKFNLKMTYSDSIDYFKECLKCNNIPLRISKGKINVFIYFDFMEVRRKEHAVTGSTTLKSA